LIYTFPKANTSQRRGGPHDRESNGSDVNSQPVTPEHRVRLVQNIIRHRKGFFVVTAFKIEQRVDRKGEKAVRRNEKVRADSS